MKIVIVEDEQIATRILLVMLEKFPFIELIVSAETVSDSIKLINDVNPDVVFLDLGLGDEDGFDVLKAIKKVKPWVQFCITTNDTRIVTAEKASKLGADLFVRKPFTADRIDEAIFSMGGHKANY